jgi:hypothetical protein
MSGYREYDLHSRGACAALTLRRYFQHSVAARATSSVHVGVETFVDRHSHGKLFSMSVISRSREARREKMWSASASILSRKCG